jgi:DNA-binding transcriptional LysR family regulator
VTTALQPPLPSLPLLRLRLAPHSSVPRRLDGAWWPRSYDLMAELPQLLAGLPRTWGTVVSVVVNGAAWSALPGRMLVCNQVVRLRRTTTAHAPNSVVLLSPGLGRWDLLVVPPDTTEEAAEPLMVGAAGERG